MKTLLALLLSAITAMAGGSASSSTSFTPNCVGGCQQWCEMVWSTNDGSGRIAGVADLSGSGRPFIGEGTTKNPKWTNSAQNGRPAAVFSSSLSQAFTNKVLSATGLSGDSLYGIYVGKAATSGANYEAWTAASTATNAQFGCDAASAGIKSFDQLNTTSTVAANLSTKFTQVTVALQYQGGTTNGANQSVITNGVACPQNDAQTMSGIMNLGTYGSVLTVFSDQYTCGVCLYKYVPNPSQRALLNEYWHNQYKCYP